MNRYAYIALLFLSMVALACEPEIGDSCSTNSECSMQGDRVCDRSQPGGYCLMIDCDPDTCPGEAVCVEFLEERRARRYCMRRCSKDGDCRDEYVCIVPEEVEALILDEGGEEDQFCTMEIPDEE